MEGASKKKEIPLEEEPTRITLKEYQDQETRLSKQEFRIQALMSAVEETQKDMRKNQQENQQKLSLVENSLGDITKLLTTVASNIQDKTATGIPVPETPHPPQRTRFETSTPFTAIRSGIDPLIERREESANSPEDSFFPGNRNSHNQSRGIYQEPPKTNITSLSINPMDIPEDNPRIKNVQNGVILETKKNHVEFDGTEVELFIKRIEKLAELQQAGGQDIALQLPFIIKDKKIRETIENMEGHENRDWNLLKKEMKRKWGRVSPTRRYTEESIPALISNIQTTGGIKTKEEYFKFIGEYEEMLLYFIKMGYKKIQAEDGDNLWKALSWELRREVTRELVHTNNIQKTKDGSFVAPELEVLKEHVEGVLALWDLGGPKQQAQKEVSQNQTLKDTEEKFKFLEDRINKLTSNISKQAPPHMDRRPENNRPAYRPPAVEGQKYQMKCYYCEEEGHTVFLCGKLSEDIKAGKVFKRGSTYYYPNREVIEPKTGDTFYKLVQNYFEETQKANKQNQELVKTEEPNEQPKVSTSAMITIDRSKWEPPEVKVSPEIMVGFGLRRGRKKAPEPEVEPEPEPEEQEPEVISQPRRNNPATKKKKVPGAWTQAESEDGDIEGEPGATRGKEKSRISKESGFLEEFEKTMEKIKIGGSLKNKIFKQQVTLTLEELFLISPNIIQKLQKLTEGQEEEKVVNSGAFIKKNMEKFPHQKMEESEDDCYNYQQLSYACPLGFINILINGKRVRALVDTGAEMNIIPESLATAAQLPTKEVNMRVQGVGGHTVPIVGLAQNVELFLINDEIKSANFFVIKGRAHTVLGRPFLADHNIRLELSQDKGEILSYQMETGDRLCIPICSPESPGWEMAPPKRSTGHFIIHREENQERMDWEDSDWTTPDLEPPQETPWYGEVPEWKPLEPLTSLEEYEITNKPAPGFLKVYPETEGSKLKDNWEELPGHSAGRIGLFELLDFIGTTQYLKNMEIWNDLWLMEEENVSLYNGGRLGDQVLKDCEHYKIMEESKK